MIKIDDLNLEDLFKQELKNKLNVEELFHLPEALQVQPQNTPNLDRWKKQK